MISDLIINFEQVINEDRKHKEEIFLIDVDHIVVCVENHPNHKRQAGECQNLHESEKTTKKLSYYKTYINHLTSNLQKSCI